MADVNIQLGYKDSAWFTANASLILDEGQIVYLEQTGTHKLGDGISMLSALSFLGSTGNQNLSQTLVNGNSTDGNPIILSGADKIESGNTLHYIQLDGNATITSDDSVNLNAPSVKKNGDELATEDYVDSEISAASVGKLIDNGNFDASGNLFPTAAETNPVVAQIKKGFLWTISVGGTLGGVAVTTGDVVRSLVDNPGQTASNWNITENNLGYVPENNANKTSTIVGNESSTTLFGTIKAWYDYLVSMVWLTAQIFGTWHFGLSSKTTPVDADGIIIFDTDDTNKSKKVTFTNFKAFLKTYFDTLYNKITLNIQTGYIIVTSGTSFTTPANITTSTMFKIVGVGGGGGGGGLVTANVSSAGGGGGGLFLLWISGLQPSTNYACTIGQGGSGGNAGDGSAGTDTTLTIGATTYTASGGGGGGGGTQKTGGDGGMGTNGTLNLPGQRGGDSPGASLASTDGIGGDAPWGWGTGGAQVRIGIAGINGSNYGGGGSGAKQNAIGGNGANGIIYAEYFSN